MQALKAKRAQESVLSTIQFVADVFTIVDQVIFVPTSYIMCGLANDLVR